MGRAVRGAVPVECAERFGHHLIRQDHVHATINLLSPGSPGATPLYEEAALNVVCTAGPSAKFTFFEKYDEPCSISRKKKNLAVWRVRGKTTKVLRQVFTLS